MARKSVLKFTMSAHCVVDPADVSTITQASKALEDLKAKADAEGFNGIEIKSAFTSMEIGTGDGTGD